MLPHKRTASLMLLRSLGTLKRQLTGYEHQITPVTKLSTFALRILSKRKPTTGSTYRREFYSVRRWAPQKKSDNVLRRYSYLKPAVCFRKAAIPQHRAQCNRYH